MTALLRAARSQLPVVAIAAVLAGVLVVAAGEHSTRLMIVLVGVIAIVLGASFSGNVRLFCLWGFLLTLPFDLSYRFGPVFLKLGGETAFRVELSDIFWMPLLVYLARDIWTGALRGVRIPKVAFVWLAIAGMGIAQVVVGPWRMTALQEVVRMLKIAVMFVVILNELRTPGRIVHVAMALAVSLLIQVAAGLTQFITGSAFGLIFAGEADVVKSQDVVKTGTVTRIGAFMIHPVIFGTFLATLLPTSLAMVLIRSGRWRRPLFALAIVLGVPALILTLSRAGWLTFAVGSVVLSTLFMFRTRVRRNAILPLAGAALVMMAVAIAFSGPIMTRIFKSTDASEKGREEWAEDARRMIDARPILGFGLNSYAFAAAPYTRLGERGAREFYEKARFAGLSLMPVVHNAYLQWWVELGLVGLALHLLIFAMLLHMAWRNLRVHHEELFALNVACIAGLVGYLVDLGFGNSLRQGSTLREFWVLAAMVCAIHYWRLGHAAPVHAREPARAAPPPGAEPAAT